MNKTVNSKIQAVGRFLNKHADKVAVCLMVTMLMGTVVFAAGGPAEDALWLTLTATIEKWVKRLGGVIMFVGGVMFGVGWQSNDANQKSQGISTIAAGGIVIAVASLASTFFA